MVLLISVTLGTEKCVQRTAKQHSAVADCLYQKHSTAAMMTPIQAMQAGDSTSMTRCCFAESIMC